MLPPRNGSDGRKILVGKLTVGDARHLLRNEGGGRTTASFLFQLACSTAVAASTARAIALGDVGPWHMALPLFAQYFGLLLSIPVVYAFMPHPALRPEVRKSVGWWIFFAVGAAVYVAVAAARSQRSFGAQFAEDFRRVRDWIVQAQMHWPMLLAFVGMGAGMPGRVRNLYEFGPPFVGVGLGCAMRILMLVAGWFLLPFVIEKPARAVWVLWSLLTLAEALTLYLHWDIQRRLQRLDEAEEESESS
jgi:hypothetical protein